MYIRRKVFSSIIDEETGEERLFSTTEFINEDTYLEQKEYAKKDDTKLKLLDRFDIAMYKANGKFGRKYGKANLEGDIKKAAKYDSIIGASGAGLSTIAGAATGAALGAKSGGVKGALEGAKRGATAGATFGVPIGLGQVVGGTLGTAAVKGLRKVSKKYDKAAEKQLDKIKVAEGEMSKKDFADKWYKKDKDKNKK